MHLWLPDMTHIRVLMEMNGLYSMKDRYCPVMLWNSIGELKGRCTERNGRRCWEEIKFTKVKLIVSFLIYVYVLLKIHEKWPQLQIKIQNQVFSWSFVSQREVDLMPTPVECIVLYSIILSFNLDLFSWLAFGWPFLARNVWGSFTIAWSNKFNT